MYRLLIRRSAERELRRLHPQERGRILRAIQALAQDPWPPGARKLARAEGWRIRVGDYRVLYTVEGHEVVIYLVGHRRDIYRSL